MWTSGLTGFHGELKKGRHHHDHLVISSLLCPHRGIFESEVWWDVEFDGCHCPWHRDPIEAHRPVVKPLPDARALHLVLRIRRSGGLHHDHPTSECEEGLGWGISGKSGNSMERWMGRTSRTDVWNMATDQQTHEPIQPPYLSLSLIETTLPIASGLQTPPE